MGLLRIGHAADGYAPLFGVAPAPASPCTWDRVCRYAKNIFVAGAFTLTGAMIGAGVGVSLAMQIDSEVITRGNSADFEVDSTFGLRFSDRLAAVAGAVAGGAIGLVLAIYPMATENPNPFAGVKCIFNILCQS